MWFRIGERGGFFKNIMKIYRKSFEELINSQFSLTN
jgi:hypothetical protein